MRRNDAVDHLVGDGHDGPVHAVAISIHQRHILSRRSDDSPYDCGFVNQIRLDEQRIVVNFDFVKTSDSE